MAVVPFTFWDDTVQPNHTYKYRVEVQLVNPAYGWRYGLKDPKLKTEPLISTGKITTGLVTVHSDIAFFVSNGIDGNDGVSGMIFKQNAGKWYQGSFSAQRGQKVGASISVPDEGMNRFMDADTGFTLVDAVPGPNGLRVILQDSGGNLVTRDAREDWNRSDRQELMEKVQKRVADAAAAAAATSTAPAVIPEGGIQVMPNNPGRGPTTNRVRVNQ
jgi:hypothetical protein